MSNFQAITQHSLFQKPFQTPTSSWMKQSATNSPVNEVSKVTTSHVHYNRSAVARFPSQVIPELHSQTSTRLSSSPLAFCPEGSNKLENNSDLWKTLFPSYSLITSLCAVLAHSTGCTGTQRMQQECSVAQHIFVLYQSIGGTEPHDPTRAAPTHESKQPENQAVTALPACCAKWTSE